MCFSSLFVYITSFRLEGATYLPSSITWFMPSSSLRM